MRLRFAHIICILLAARGLSLAAGVNNAQLEPSINDLAQELTPIDFAGCDSLTNGSLLGRVIALSPSHGTYYNTEEQLWKWQRATMWTTVEDLYTTEYTRLIAQMLENAGAVVLQPRPRVEGRNLLRWDNRWVYTEDSIGWTRGRSGMYRWAECAQEWMRFAGYPDSIWSPTQGESNYRDDCLGRGHWVNYLIGGSSLYPDYQGLGLTVDACLVIHTDGVSEEDNQTTVGTLAIISTTDDNYQTTFPNGISRLVNRDLADSLQTSIASDIRRLYCPQWTLRDMRDQRYAEARIPQVPTTLLELLSHKNMPDMQYGLQPQFRWHVARAVYKGLLRYLCSDSTTTPIIQPLPIQSCELSYYSPDTLLVRWQDTPDTLEPTAIPSYHIIEYRLAGQPWQDTVVRDTCCLLPIRANQAYEIQVRAGNAGGQSMPGQRLAARLSSNPTAPRILLIDAFQQTSGPRWFDELHYAGIQPNSYAIEDNYSIAYIGQQTHFDKQIDWTDDDNCGFGMCARNHQQNITIGNTHDYSCLRASVLAAMDYTYFSTTDRWALNHLDSTLTLVEVILGTQSEDSVWTAQQWTVIDPYLAQGGKVLITGSNIGQGTHHVVHAPVRHYMGEVQLQLGSPQTYTLYTRPNPSQLFAAQVQSLQPLENAQRIGIYTDMRISCGIEWHAGQGRLIALGFPLDAVIQWKDLYRRLVEELIINN